MTVASPLEDPPAKGLRAWLDMRWPAIEQWLRQGDAVIEVR